MKKRFKIITTVASLCLAVALMAFGVYAAANSTFTVTSSVSFTSQVAVNWGVQASGGAGNTAVNFSRTVAASVGATADTNTGESGAATGSLVTKDIGEMYFGAATEEEKTITYIITATNPSPSTAITVTCSNEEGMLKLPETNVETTVSNEVTGDGSSIADGKNATLEGFSATVGANGGTLTITITCVLQDTAIGFEATANPLKVVLNARSAG